MTPTSSVTTPNFLEELAETDKTIVVSLMEFSEYLSTLDRRKQTLYRLMEKAVNRDLVAVTNMLVDRIHDVEDLQTHPMETFYMAKHPEGDVTFDEFVATYNK